MTTNADCKDWAGHRHLYATSESTWRKTDEQKRADWANGCGHCGRRLPPELVPAWYASNELLADGVTGFAIGGRT